MPRWWTYCWPAPISFLGLLLAALVHLSRGRTDVHRGVLEATHGIAPKLLWLMNPFGGIEAITLGHVVIARNRLTATRLRAHEHAHVRQYERWGFVFPIAYVAASVIAMLRGGSPYYDNAFEREAFRVANDGDDKVQY
jgi:hypothetical protein